VRTESKMSFNVNALKPSTLFAVLLALALVGTSARAATIAIVDSGTDLNHPDLKNAKWTNLKDEDDAVDNDDNGYIDDTHGWNFAENNNKLFDKRFLGKFSKDVYTFFEIQTKKLNGVATPAEIEWVKVKIADPVFLSQLQTFGNFVHGSHVAGIAAHGSARAEIMGLKLLPTKAPKPFSAFETHSMIAAAKVASGDEMKKKLVLMAIDFLGTQQSKVFAPISAYMKGQKARVANCSFGTGFAQAKGLLGPLLEKVFGRKLEEAELNGYASYFIGAVMKGSEAAFVKGAPETLFVMAAGNDGSNNDLFPSSPANIKAMNTITVAATNGLSNIASFSNYGVKMVDIAAPGVGILSAVPGGEYVQLSGTSQAAPHVANIAGQILDVNPKLKTSEVREILMGTVDQKDFLKGKVLSGGMANSTRALAAASYSLTMSVANSVARASKEVADIAGDTTVRVNGSSAQDAFVFPLPSLSY
jgi:cell wall-associated protease